MIRLKKEEEARRLELLKRTVTNLDDFSDLSEDPYGSENNEKLKKK